MASGVVFLFAAVAVCVVSGIMLGLLFVAPAGNKNSYFRKIAKGVMVITGILVTGLLYLTFFGFSFFGF